MSWTPNLPDHSHDGDRENCECVQCDDTGRGRNPLELPPEEAEEEIRRQHEG